MTHQDQDLLQIAANLITFRVNTIQAILTQADITAGLVSNINQCLHRIEQGTAMARHVMSSQPPPLPTTTKPHPPHIQEVIT